MQVGSPRLIRADVCAASRDWHVRKRSTSEVCELVLLGLPKPACEAGGVPVELMPLVRANNRIYTNCNYEPPISCCASGMCVGSTAAQLHLEHYLDELAKVYCIRKGQQDQRRGRSGHLCSLVQKALRSWFDRLDRSHDSPGNPQSTRVSPHSPLIFKQ